MAKTLIQQLEEERKKRAASSFAQSVESSRNSSAPTMRERQSQATASNAAPKESSASSTSQPLPSNQVWTKSASTTSVRDTSSTPNFAELNRRYVTMSKQAGILEGLSKSGKTASDRSYDQHLQQFQKAYTDFEDYQKKYQDYTSEETTRKRREETQRQLDQQLEAQRTGQQLNRFANYIPQEYRQRMREQGARADQQEIDRLRRQLKADDEILAGYQQQREKDRLLGLDLEAIKAQMDEKAARQEELWQSYLKSTGGVSWGATRESLNPDLAREIEDLQTEYDKAQNLQWRRDQGNQYQALANQPDFASHSQYIQANDPETMLPQLRQQESELIYRISNDPSAPASLSTQLQDVQQQIRDYQTLQEQVGATYHDMTGENDAAQRFRYATDQERGVYYYLVNTGRYQEAADYADYLDYNLNERRQAQRVENAQAFARNHPVLSTLASVAQFLASGVGQLDLMVQKAENAGSGKPVDFNTSWQDPHFSSAATRGTISQDLNEKYGTLDESIPVIGGMGAGNLYQVGTSMLDSAAVLALTAATGMPPIVGTSLLGGAAATAASQDAHNRGLSDSQAIATGLMAGIWETMFEYVSIDNLLKPSMSAGSLRSALGAAAKQAGIEASEEFLTTAANTLSDLAINGDQSQLMGDYQRYLAQGDSASRAAAKTFGGALNTALQDALAGAISGGVMGGGKAALVTMLPTRTTSTQTQTRPSVEQTQALAHQMEAEAASARAPEGQGQGAEPLPTAPQQAQDGGQQVEMLPMVEQPATRQIETLPMAQPQTNENGLVAYTSREQENLSSGKRNFILRTVSEFKQFISKALTQKNNTDRAYLGKIPDSVVDQVKAATGLDVSGFSFMINGDDIRHIFNSHGDEKKEAARGQIAVTQDNLPLLPEVLSNPDRVYLSDKLDGKGRKAIFFEKKIGDLFITVQGVGNGKQVLQTDSVRIRKKKEPASARLNTGAASPEIYARSEVPQGSSGSSLPQSSAPVNPNTAQQDASPDTQQGDTIGIQFHSEPGMSEGDFPIDTPRLNRMVERATAEVNQALSQRTMSRADVEQTVSAMLSKEFGMTKANADSLATRFGAQYQSIIDQGSARLSREMDEGDGPRQASQANNTWQNATQMTPEERDAAGMEPGGEEYTTRTEAYSNDQARALIDRLGWDGTYQYLMQNDTWNPADVKAAVEVGRHLLEQARTETDPKAKEALYEQAGQIGMRYQQDRSAAGRSLQASAEYASDPVLEAVGKVRQVIEQSSEQMTEEQQTAAVSDVVERAEEMQRVIDETDSFEDSLVRHLVEKAKTRLAKSNQGNHRVLSAVVQDLSNFINRHIETHTASSEARTAFGRISDYLNNAEDYNRISEAARDALLSEYKEGSAEYDMLQSLDGANMLYDFVHANRSIVSAVRQAMKSDGITFAKLLTRYIESGDISDVKDSVFNFIADRVALNNPEASLPLLRDAVDAYIDSALDESKQRRIASIRRHIEKMPGNARRSVMSRVIEAYRIGMFDSPESQADAIKYIAGTDVSSSDASAISSAFKAIVDDSSSKVALIDLIERYAKDRGITKTVVRGNVKDVARYIHDNLSNMSTETLSNLARASLDDYISMKYGDPASLGQRMKTILVLNHLFRPITWMRNVVGNFAFAGIDSASNGLATAMDVLMSKRTGTRSTVTGPNFLSKEARSAKWQAFNQSVTAVYLGLNLDGGTNRYGQTGTRTFRMNSETKSAVLTRTLSKLERNLSYALTSSDQFFKGGVQATQQARIQQLLDSGQIDPERLGVDVTPEEYAAWRGKELAKYRTFQDDSTMSILSQGIHDLFNIAGIGDTGERFYKGRGKIKAFGLGDAIITYPKVPGNIASRVLEYSPAGLAKGIIDISRVLKSGSKATVQAQHKAVSELARGITGAALIGIAAVAAANGIIRSTDDDDNLDEKTLNRAEGVNSLQVNLSALLRFWAEDGAEWRQGDRLVTIDFLQPVNSWLALGCFINSYFMDGERDEAYDGLTASMNAMANSMESFPALSLLQNISDNLKYSGDGKNAIVATAEEVRQGLASSVVPSFIRSIATAADPYQRVTTSGQYGAVSFYDFINQKTGIKAEWLKALAEFFDDTLKAGETADTIASAIPILRQTLPMKLDNYGQPMGYTGSRPLDVANALVLPGSVYSYNQRELTKVLSEVSAYTGTINFYPNRNPVKSVEYGGTKHEMTFDQRQEYQKTYGTVYYDMANELIQTQVWQDADPMTRADMLSQIESIASAQARVHFMDTIGQDYTGSESARLIAKLDEMAAGGVDFATYYDWKNRLSAFSGDEKQADILSALASSGLSETQQRTLYYGVGGYSISEEKLAQGATVGLNEDDLKVWRYRFDQAAKVDGWSAQQISDNLIQPSADLSADQKHVLGDMFLTEYIPIEQAWDVDYSSPDAYILSQLPDSAQDRYEAIVQDYLTPQQWSDIYNRYSGYKRKDQKIAAMMADGYSESEAKTLYGWMSKDIDDSYYVGKMSDAALYYWQNGLGAEDIMSPKQWLTLTEEYAGVDYQTALEAMREAGYAEYYASIFANWLSHM